LATEEQHLAQFEHNEQIARRLSEAADYDWAVIASFYAALHLVQAYFERTGIRADSHRQRGREILRLDALQGVFEAYTILRQYSEQCRYECRRVSMTEYEAIQTGVFASVVTHLRSLMGVT
jgi:hypothetical protein